MCKYIPVRFWIAVMMFLTTYVNYTTLVNMSISIMSMTTTMKDTKPDCLQDAAIDDDVPHHLPNHGPRYDWTEAIQAQILGSFFWGHILTSVLGGTTAEYFGAFHVILWSNVGCAIFNSLTVYAAYWHYIALMVCRFFLGAFQGMVYPALQTLVSKWAPPDEKGKFLGCLMGNTLSTVITWPLLGYVISRYGWPWGFHIITIQIALFCILFHSICSDSPEDHHFISQEEKDYIKRAQGNTVTQKRRFPPIRAILKNGPFWILIISFFGNLWGLFLQLQGVPKYLSEVVGFQLKKAGFIAALPHISRLLFGIGIGFLEDCLETYSLLSAKTIRKQFTWFSHIIPGFLMIGMYFCGCNPYPTVILLTLSMGFNGAVAVTSMQNPQDLAPNFAGTIYGLMHLIGGTAGAIAPAVSGILIKDKNGVKEWHYIFILGGIIYIITGAIFIIFGSVKEQSWNRTVNEEA